MIDPAFYLDNAATTAPFPEVIQGALPFLETAYGNPSSLHALGVEASRAVKGAREALARLVGVPPKGVIFTSGGTESDNLALRGVFASERLKGDRLLVSAIEHPAVAETARALAGQGVRLEVIPVTRDGVVDLPRLEAMLDGDVRMVSVMAINNEIGTRQPLVEIGALLRQKASRAIFHVDAVQAFAKEPIPWREAGVHMLSVSGHKIHGVKGVGALICCQPVPLAPLQMGGGQEEGLRSGTENPFGVVALAHAAQEASRMHTEQRKARAAYHQKWLAFLDGFPRVQVYRSEHETPYMINLRVEPVPAEVILHHLEQEGVLVSTGSACHTRKPEPSQVLLAVGLERQEALSSVRLSFSIHNTLESLERLFPAVERAFNKLAKL